MSMGLSMLATVLSLLLAVGILDAAPYQELQPRAGYVPVYIREGETPLSEIHPGLAEAFKEEPSYGSNSDIIPASSDESNSNGQTMSEEQGDSLPDLADEPIIINTSSEEEVNKKIEDIKEPKVNVAEAAKEAIKEIVSVFETEMLEKLGLSENNEQSSKSEDKREVQNIKPLEETIGNDESKLSAAKVVDKTLEKSSDVLTVEAFKAKDFNKESNQDDGIDVPEDVPLDQ